MVLGHSVKLYRHMMKNMISNLILHERIETTNARAKHLMRQTNKLIHFAKKADQGFTSPLNLIKGRVATEKVLKKLMMETVPKLDNVSQNFVVVGDIHRYRKGDNAPMVYVTIRNSEKAEAVKLQKKEEKEKALAKTRDVKAFHREMLNQEKAYYQAKMNENPEAAEFFKAKIARVEYDQWIQDKKKGEKRILFVV